MDIIATDRQHDSSWPMYRSLVGVGVVCALLIVAVFIYSSPRIEANRAALLKQAIFKVLPGTVSFGEFDVGTTVYAGFDGEAQLVGIALEAAAMGYQDTVKILYGYDPGRQLIVGMQVLDSRETPGLGDRIEKDPVFGQNFVALDVQLANDGDSLRNPIVLVKPGSKTQAWEIDGIAGATISSAAIARMLDTSSKQWIPLLYQRRDAFVPAAEISDGD